MNMPKLCVLLVGHCCPACWQPCILRKFANLLFPLYERFTSGHDHARVRYVPGPSTADFKAVHSLRIGSVAAGMVLPHTCKCRDVIRPLADAGKPSQTISAFPTRARSPPSRRQFHVALRAVSDVCKYGIVFLQLGRPLAVHAVDRL